MCLAILQPPIALTSDDEFRRRRGEGVLCLPYRWRHLAGPLPIVELDVHVVDLQAAVAHLGPAGPLNLATVDGHGLKRKKR